MAGTLRLCERLAVVRKVWPELTEKPDHQLWWECLQIESVLAPGGKLVPADEERERQIRELAKGTAA